MMVGFLEIVEINLVLEDRPYVWRMWVLDCAIVSKDTSTEAEILLQIPNALVLREVRVYDREELGIRLSDNHHFGFIDSLCLTFGQFTNFIELLFSYLQNEWPKPDDFKRYFLALLKFFVQSVVVKRTNLMLNCLVSQINYFASLWLDLLLCLWSSLVWWEAS